MQRQGMGMWACPGISIYHDAKDRTVIAEVELPGIRKKDIMLEAGREGFCVKAKRDDVTYDSCFHFEDRVYPARVHAEFDNGLLRVTAPIDREELRAKRVTIT